MIHFECVCVCFVHVRYETWVEVHFLAYVCLTKSFEILDFQEGYLCLEMPGVGVIGRSGDGVILSVSRK